MKLTSHFGGRNVSPLTGLEKAIQRTQGGALRFSPRRSALGWYVDAFQAEDCGF